MFKITVIKNEKKKQYIAEYFASHRNGYIVIKCENLVNFVHVYTKDFDSITIEMI